MSFELADRKSSMTAMSFELADRKSSMTAMSFELADRKSSRTASLRGRQRGQARRAIELIPYRV
jgi:hypothetical protein